MYNNCHGPSIMMIFKSYSCIQNNRRVVKNRLYTRPHKFAMAFAPPGNNAGLPAPIMPANPPTLYDIINSKDYVQRLIKSKGESPFPAE